ncbi:MAG: hypothetical protein KAG19_04885 [Methylococcales bacterium]|nr:hypothetical protein [Methylococcales bacterium]
MFFIAKIAMNSSFRFLLLSVLLIMPMLSGAAEGIDVSLKKGTILLTPIHGGDGSGWGKDNCSACHFKNRIHKNTSETVRNMVKDVGFTTCAGCHGQNGTKTPRLCNVCHNPSLVPSTPSLVGTPHYFEGNGVGALGDKDCVVCHKSSDMNGQFNPETDLTTYSNTGTQSRTRFCLGCHNTTHQQAGHEMKARFPKDPLVNIEQQYNTIEKHGFLAGTKKGIFTGLRKGSGYQYPDVVECTDCHAMHGTHNPKLIIDQSNAGLKRLTPSLRNLPVPIKVGNGDYSQLCVTCHDMDKKVDHASRDTGNGLSGVHVVGVNCSSCHTHSMIPQEGIPATITVDVSQAKGELLLTPRHGYGGLGWGKEDCAGCHLMPRIHLNAPSNIRNISASVGYVGCMGCHGQNGTEAERQCIVCHNSQKLPKLPILQGAETHDFKTNQVNPLSDKDCVTCHYKSDMDSQFEAKTDLTHVANAPYRIDLPYKNGVEFCLRCHNETHQQQGFSMIPRFLRDPLVKIEDSYQYLDMHGYPKGSGQRTYSGLSLGTYSYGDLVECTDCHAMHGTHNKKLIVDRTDAGMSKLDPSIRDIPVRIDVKENGDYSQLCVTCHAMDNVIEQGDQDTGNGLAGVHQVGTDCRECHVHGMATQTGL